MRSLSIGLAGAMVVIVAGCGGDSGGSSVGSTPGPASPVVPVAPVSVPPANTVVELTTDELRELARGHRIRSATIYDDGVDGMMLSDVSAGQRFSAPRPGTAAAAASLARALTDGGATVAIKHGPKP